MNIKSFAFHTLGATMAVSKVVISLDFPGGVVSAKYPEGTVGGKYRYWIEDLSGQLKDACEVDALVSDELGAPHGPVVLEYNAFAARLDVDGNELPGSRIMKSFQVPADVVPPPNVEIDIPNRMTVSVDDAPTVTPSARRG